MRKNYPGKYNATQLPRTVLQTARNAYSKALKEVLPSFQGDTIQLN